MTYREAINLGEKVLNMADVADAKIDAWLLLEMVCKIDRSFYYLHMEDEVAEEQLSEYEIALRNVQNMCRYNILSVKQSLWD